MRELSMEEMDKVSGGAGNPNPQKFSIGEKVLLRMYKDFGVGSITGVSYTRDGWQYDAVFDAGTITALEDEFMAAK